MSAYTLHLGDCIDVLRTLADCSVDAIVTDPPYHLTTGKKGGNGPASANLDSPAGRARVNTGFMGQQWDGGAIAHSVELWSEALRVLAPGGHLLAFGGSRTIHRQICAIEDAGFEIRDQLMYLYGTGFPKSLNVSKALDKAAGAARPVIGVSSVTGARSGSAIDDGAGYTPGRTFQNDAPVMNYATAPATDAARQWDGWGTALKPAYEPIIMARKPLAKGLTVAANVTTHGTGAINIDACRVPFASAADEGESKNKNAHADFGSGPRENAVFGQDNRARGVNGNYDPPGRWPANVLHDGSDEVIAAFPATTSVGHAPATRGAGGVSTNGHGGQRDLAERHFDSGNAARFFYTAKTSRSDRDEGLAAGANIHPTVKPTSLMAYLVRLVTPPGGTVLDMFMGSGSTGKAAMLEGFDFIGIDMTAEYVAIAEARIAHAQAAYAARAVAPAAPAQTDLFDA